MAKFAEADARRFKEKFVCRKCKKVIHTSNRKIALGEVSCRNCGRHVFKAKRKK